jgi:hypothetical protein
VTVTATEDDLVELERLGFWTATATLELGEILAADASAVTRTATLLDGQWPEPGTTGTSSITTYRGDPKEALGLSFTAVDVAGLDGGSRRGWCPATGRLTRSTPAPSR